MKRCFKKSVAMLLLLTLLVLTMSGFTAVEEESEAEDFAPAGETLVLEETGEIAVEAPDSEAPDMESADEAPALEETDEIAEEAPAPEAPAPAPADEVPVSEALPAASSTVPNVTNVTARQINDTQFVIELDSDSAGEMPGYFSMHKILQGAVWEGKHITLDLTAGHNTFTYDVIVDDMIVQWFSYGTFDEEQGIYSEYIPIEYTQYTEGDYTYEVAGGKVTIIEYNGPGGDVVIPETLGGNPVEMLASFMFYNLYESQTHVERGDIFSVTIPKSVTMMYVNCFDRVPNLISIDVSPESSVFSSIDGVLFSKDKTILYKCPNGKSGVYAVPDGVKSFFTDSMIATKLTDITIPASVEHMEDTIFTYCEYLESVTFLGLTTFGDDNNFFGNPDILIRGLEGSPAQAYAAKWGYAFEVIQAPVDPSPTPPAVSAPATGKTNNPKTADMSEPIVWFVALIFAVGVISALSVTRKKRVTGK